MAMELKVTEYTMPSEIIFNFDELKKELAEKVETYKTLVYSDSEIKLAKADKANLNKLKKALNDERIRREKEYMMPFNAFKAKIGELIALVDEPIQVIDQQIKAADEKRKEQKQAEIEAMFKSAGFPEWVTLEQVFESRWLNVTVSASEIQDALAEKSYKILCDTRTLNSLTEYAFEALEEYKRTLDLNRAITEGQRLADMQARKAQAKAQEQITIEQAAKAPEIVIEPIPEAAQKQPEEPKMWLKFEAELTLTDAKALKAFFNLRGIQFRAI